MRGKNIFLDDGGKTLTFTVQLFNVSSTAAASSTVQSARDQRTRRCGETSVRNGLILGCEKVALCLLVPPMSAISSSVHYLLHVLLCFAAKRAQGSNPTKTASQATKTMSTPTTFVAVTPFSQEAGGSDRSAQASGEMGVGRPALGRVGM